MTGIETGKQLELTEEQIDEFDGDIAEIEEVTHDVELIEGEDAVLKVDTGNWDEWWEEESSITVPDEGGPELTIRDDPEILEEPPDRGAAVVVEYVGHMDNFISWIVSIYVFRDGKIVGRAEPPGSVFGNRDAPNEVAALYEANNQAVKHGVPMYIEPVKLEILE